MAGARDLKFFGGDTPQGELESNNLHGVAVKKIKVKGQ